MNLSRRESIKLVGAAAVGVLAGVTKGADITSGKIPPRQPLDEFAKDANLFAALVRGVRAMKARKPSDPLSWFYQAAIHGVTAEMIQVQAARDPRIITVDQKKYWNQCPHYGQASANFLPWHRAYTHYFERILRAHTGEPRFSLPYWDYSKPENYRFPKEFGTRKLAVPIDGDDKNPLWHDDRNTYFGSWEHWAGNNLPYSQLTPEAVDWSPARDTMVFFGVTERDGLGGAVGDEDSSTRGRLESFPHDPIHRLTGIIVPPQTVPDPQDPGKTIVKDSYSLGMSGPPTAGFDPIFCIHHSNIDRLWAEWSVMPGKAWGAFPPQNWFDDAAWTFFDVAMKNGQLEAVEVNESRKAYFDYRALGIAFKYEDLSKTPLILPDPIPSPPAPPAPIPLLLAKITAPMKISGLRAERIDTAAEAQKLKSAFADAKSIPINAPQKKRVLMRLNGVNLGSVNATGFDVHLTGDTTGKPKRTDSSFVGTIALFRHDGHAHPSAGHDSHDGPAATATAQARPSDTFDVTRALESAGLTDPAKMHVVIVPYSLSATVDGQKPILETNALTFDSIEFFSK